eukprot:209211-Alexandrium_andersonii.AAC.1
MCIRDRVQVVHELAPQVIFSGMAHVAAADPQADDLAVPVLAADASGQDLLVAAAHELQALGGAESAPGIHLPFSDTSASATQAALTGLRTNGHSGYVTL